MVDLVAQDRHRPQLHGGACRVEHPDGGAVVGLKQRGRGQLNDLLVLLDNPALHRGAKAHGFRWVGQRDAHREGPRDGIGGRADLTDAAHGLDVGIAKQRDDDGDVRWRAAQDPLGHLELGLFLIDPRDANHHLTGGDNLSGLGADRGHDAGILGAQVGVAEALDGVRPASCADSTFACANFNRRAAVS